jgi:NADH dehydrogenase
VVVESVEAMRSPLKAVPISYTGAAGDDEPVLIVGEDVLDHDLERVIGKGTATRTYSITAPCPGTRLRSRSLPGTCHATSSAKHGGQSAIVALARARFSSRSKRSFGCIPGQGVVESSGTSHHDTMAEVDVVTGAFGYTGKYITERLVQADRSVRTLTGHPNRPNPFGDRIAVAPLDFEDRRELVQDLRGAATLYNTYWVRFSYGDVTFERAVRNSQTLIDAAREAGVGRNVHVSITNPSEDSPFPYFRGKARVEAIIRASGLSFAIVRPTVVFGREDILINNLAFILRRLPVFGVPGSGSYRLRPVSVEDVADICVRAGAAGDDHVIDAVGPEIFTFEELLRTIARALGRRVAFVHVPTTVALAAAAGIGRLVGDVLATRDELEGLMAELVMTDGPATGTRVLTEWLAENATTIGTRYASEVSRHYRRHPNAAALKGV